MIKQRRYRPQLGDKRYIRRDDKGRIKRSVEESRSLSADARQKARNDPGPGQGDRWRSSLQITLCQAKGRRLKVFQAQFGLLMTPSRRRRAEPLRCAPGASIRTCSPMARRAFTQDPQAVQAAIAYPETPLKRPVGSSGAFRAWKRQTCRGPRAAKKGRGQAGARPQAPAPPRTRPRTAPRSDSGGDRGGQARRRKKASGARVQTAPRSARFRKRGRCGKPPMRKPGRRRQRRWPSARRALPQGWRRKAKPAGQPGRRQVAPPNRLSSPVSGSSGRSARRERNLQPRRRPGQFSVKNRPPSLRSAAWCSLGCLGRLDL